MIAGSSEKLSTSDQEDDYCPVLPPHLQKEDKLGTEKNPEGAESEADSEDDAYGPALPPHLLKNKQKFRETKTAPETKRVLGPSLPKGYTPSDIPTASYNEENEASGIGHIST